MEQLSADYAMAPSCTVFHLLYLMVPGPNKVLDLPSHIVYLTAYFVSGRKLLCNRHGMLDRDSFYECTAEFRFFWMNGKLVESGASEAPIAHHRYRFSLIHVYKCEGWATIL